MKQTSQKSVETQAPDERKPWRFWILGVLLLGLLVYREALIPGQILFTTDDGIGAISMRKNTLPHAFLGGWDDSIAVGQPNLVMPSFTNALLTLLPVPVFINWIHYIDLGLASLFLMLFLKLRGVRPEAAGLAALTAFWLGSNFYLTYAGHIGKFGVLLFAALFLYLIELAVQRRSAGWAALAGGAMGAMFLEQADSGLFFALVLGPYAILRAVRMGLPLVPAMVRIVVPVVALSAMIGLHAVISGYVMFGMEAPEASEATSREAHLQELWEYCTQWSLPPEELLEWIAPGYFGWRTGEEQGPYWGRLGRSAGWEETGRGFQNFKLETFYMGGIPLLFFALGVAVIAARKVPLSFDRAEGWFWVVAVGVTLLLGFGKFFPLYKLFWMLPGMSSIRNPVKFLQVTQLGMAILAGFGLDAWIRYGLKAKPDADSARFYRGFFRAGLGVAVLFLVGFLLLALARDNALSRFAQDWGQYAEVIVANRIRAMGWAAMMLAVGWGIGLWWLKSQGAIKGWVRHLPLMLVAVVAMDVLVHRGIYVKSVSKESLVGDQEALTFIEQNLGHQRLMLLSPQGIYNNWLTIQMPYRNIPTFNIPQMRMPEDYKSYFAAFGARPMHMWPHFAVGLLMGPAQFYNQFQGDPTFRDRFDLAFVFNFVPFRDGVMTVAATPQQPGREAILRPRETWFRYALFSHWEAAEPGQALARLRDVNPPLSRVVVPSEVAATLPEVAGGQSGPVGEVTVKRYRPGRVELRVSAPGPAVLRASEKYMSHWTATINDKPADVFRCDYLFQGVVVPAGRSTVVLAYQPPLGTLWLLIAGFVGLLAAGAMVMREGRAGKSPG
ncbi:MAG TPA: hypothetical protein PKE55_11115 [Kiritimatiellia bacterium]|nr:hypothetical protein [Kiritimatiellia bacterium]